MISSYPCIFQKDSPAVQCSFCSKPKPSRLALPATHPPLPPAARPLPPPVARPPPPPSRSSLSTSGKATTHCPTQQATRPPPTAFPSRPPPPRASASKRPADNELPFGRAVEEVKRRKTHSQAERLAYVNRFEKALNVLGNVCPLCYINGHQTPPHRAQNCPVLTQEQIKDVTSEMYQLFRKSLRYEKGRKICYHCHVPQYHDMLHPSFAKGGGACVHPDTLVPTAFGIFHDSHLRQAAEAHFQVEWPNLQDFAVWCRADPPVGEQSNLSALFIWYTLTLQ